MNKSTALHLAAVYGIHLPLGPLTSSDLTLILQAAKQHGYQGR